MTTAIYKKTKILKDKSGYHVNGKTFTDLKTCTDFIDVQHILDFKK